MIVNPLSQQSTLMDRRDFLTLRKSKPVPVPQPFGERGINSGLAPYNGAWTNKEIAHLLKRTMFGAAKADMDFFRTMTPSQAVDVLLNMGTVPSPPVKNYDNNNIPASDPDYAIAQGNTWVNTYSSDGSVNSRRVASLKSWWVGLMLNQERTIAEKMVLFWHNHFATESTEYGRGTYGYQYHSLIRQYALGNFKQFVRAMTLDRAMLRYLNGYLNTNTAPDENYSRELQELFTLGKENNPNYTEADVQAAARVLTGWRINFSDDTVLFAVNRHDKDPKQFSSFYNNTVIAGRSDATAGDVELDDLLNMIFSKSIEVSEFIVKKLYRWFVYYTIDASTETNVIKPLALQLRNGNWEIKPVLETLLKSEHFFDPLSQGCLIKSPLEKVVGTCREFNVQFPPVSDHVNVYNMWAYLRNTAANLQQNITDPPGVSGWSAYYQVPQFYEIWINSDTLPKRNRFTDTMISNGFTQNGNKIVIDAIAFTKSLPNPGDPNQLINDVLDIIYRVPLSDQSKQIIKKQFLLQGLDSDYYWTNAWNIYLGNPNDMAAFNTVNNRLKDMYKYFMNLAEYQLA